MDMLTERKPTEKLEYLYKEILTFRNIFGSTKYTIEQMQLAFRALTFVYLRLVPENDKEQNQAAFAFEAVANEWTRRRVMMEMRDIARKQS